MGLVEHRRHAEKLPGARVAVLTVSDSRTKETDESGRIAKKLFEERGHRIGFYAVLPNDPRTISEEVARLEKQRLDLVLTIGGTGIGPKDRTIEAVSGLLARPLPGFGELFRHLSFPDIGSAAMLSRAVMGITAGGTIVVSVPGSLQAVRLALERLLLPELGHLVGELRK